MANQTRKQIADAISASHAERLALEAAIRERDKLSEESHKIRAALDALHAEPDGARVVEREIGGVIVKIASGEKANEISALARRRDQGPELLRAANNEIEKRRRELSCAVSAKLTGIQAKLAERVMGLLRDATALTRDAAEFERELVAAGLHDEKFFAARFPGIRDLTLDEYNTGTIIRDRLKEGGYVS